MKWKEHILSLERPWEKVGVGKKFPVLLTCLITKLVAIQSTSVVIMKCTEESGVEGESEVWYLQIGSLPLASSRIGI